jgi:RsiW-degrading membrane proteinase PrsW (M82 family)
VISGLAGGRVWRRPALLLLAALVLPLGIVTVANYAPLAAEEPVSTGLSLILVLAAATMLLLVIRTLAPDTQRGPAVAGLLWGAAAATYMAGIATEPWGRILASLLAGQEGQLWSALLAGPPLEEAYKLLGVALVAFAWPAAINGARRGLVLGVMVGLGFGVVEDANYLAIFSLQQLGLGGPLESVTSLFLFRAMGGLFAHAALTGLTGLAIGWTLVSRSRLRWLAVVAAWLLVSAIHAALNSDVLMPPTPRWILGDLPAALVTFSVRALPLFAVLVILIALNRRAREPAVAF